MSSTRRDFLLATGAAVATAALAGEASAQAPATAPAAPAPVRTGRPSADEALHMLMQGNERFIAGKSTQPCRTPADFKAVAEGQAPMAVIVACADSRVAPEILFDQGVVDELVDDRVDDRWIPEEHRLNSRQGDTPTVHGRDRVG